MPRASRIVVDTMTAAMAFAASYAVVRGLRPQQRLPVRAQQPAPEHDASHGWSRWQVIAQETWRRADEDRLLAVAAGVVFYGLLALFPAITALVSVYGLLADPRMISQHLSLLSDIVPAEIIGIVDDELLRLTSKSGANLGTAFVASLVLALWSANGGMKAMIDALNAVNEQRETRSFVRLNATALGLTLGALLAMIAAVVAVIAVPLVMAVIGQGEASTSLLQ